MNSETSTGLLEIDPKTYGRLLDKRVPVYLSATFNELHLAKCDEVKFLQINHGKTKFGMVVGIKDKRLISPISSPFGALWPFGSSAGIDEYEAAVELLVAYAKSKGVRAIQVTMAPLFYENNNLSKCVSAFFNRGFSIRYVDLNHHFQLSKFDPLKTSHLGSAARRNLKLSLDANFTFTVCNSGEQKKRVYDIIEENRAAKGFPLKMTWENLKDTAGVLPVDFFFVGREGEASASAIVYRVFPGVAQVVYWGDRLKHRSYHPMYFLAHRLFEFYRAKKFIYLDLGPSTDEGQANIGLCDFKEGLGCDVSAKYTYSYSF